MYNWQGLLAYKHQRVYELLGLLDYSPVRRPCGYFLNDNGTKKCDRNVADAVRGNVPRLKMSALGTPLCAKTI